MDNIPTYESMVISLNAWYLEVMEDNFEEDSIWLEDLLEDFDKRINRMNYNTLHYWCVNLNII